MPTAPRQFGKSALDRAIVASVAAMIGFNILVLAQQVQSAPVLASASAVSAQA
jgi:hypothetical protein